MKKPNNIIKLIKGATKRRKDHEGNGREINRSALKTEKYKNKEERLIPHVPQAGQE